jgi:hypothetical protein
MMVVVRPFFFLSRPSLSRDDSSSNSERKVEQLTVVKVKDGARTYAVGSRQ